MTTKRVIPRGGEGEGKRPKELQTRRETQSKGKGTRAEEETRVFWKKKGGAAFSGKRKTWRGIREEKERRESGIKPRIQEKKGLLESTRGKSRYGAKESAIRGKKWRRSWEGVALVLWGREKRLRMQKKEIRGPDRGGGGGL